MPHLDHTGPEFQGPKSGRKLGFCKAENEKAEYCLGQGMGLKRKSENGLRLGLGKRLQSSNIFNNK